MTHYSSKHGIVRRNPAELYMAFTDMSALTRFLPEDKKGDVSADYDSISVKVQGMNMGGRVVDRQPYSKISLKGEGVPFECSASLHFDPSADGTDFHVEVDADLNFMLKMMLGSKLQEALDRIVDGLVDASNGKIPEDIPQDLKDKMNFS